MSNVQNRKRYSTQLTEIGPAGGVAYLICISVTPSSRRLAAAGLFNASRQCDLIELCLDNFKKSPGVGAPLKVVDKPMLVSCRRVRDGGHWDGSEDDRIQLLRFAMVAGPVYVELDLAIADQIPRFGSTKRVISHTNLNGVLNQAAIEAARFHRQCNCQRSGK